MEYTLRKAKEADMPAVLRLIKELAVYENKPDAVEIGTETLIADGFGKNPLFICMVAEVDGIIRGMALFYFRYSTWRGKTVHLEDLVVQEDFRRKGLGLALYRSFVQFAKAQQVRRAEWAVLDWNEPAIAFYQKTGASILRDWDTVQFDQDAYLRFLEESER